ncbi:unnamed protein product [Ectocarpus sp. 12 AP-2014]
MSSSVLEAIAARNAAQRRRVVEKKHGETIDVPEGSGLLVTGCRGCTINAPGRSSSVTIERCDAGTRVDVGSVVAALEIIHCTDVQVSVARCRTITVDVSTDVTLTCKCQPPSGQEAEQQQQQQRGGGEAKVHPSEAADEASAIRLFTSCSEGVTVRYEGLLSQPPPGPVDAADPAVAADATAVTYRVPKDWRHEKGDGPRSVTRVSGAGSGGGGGACCKTLRCDQYGIPLEEVEAAEAGVAWTWEHGRGGGPAVAVVRG